MKENLDIFADFILTSLNQSVANSIFPSILKNADVCSVFNKGDTNLKDNYRPVTKLQNISKICEQCMFQQISKFMEPYLSNGNHMSIKEALLVHF